MINPPLPGVDHLLPCPAGAISPHPSITSVTAAWPRRHGIWPIRPELDHLWPSLSPSPSGEGESARLAKQVQRTAQDFRRPKCPPPPTLRLRSGQALASVGRRIGHYAELPSPPIPLSLPGRGQGEGETLANGCTLPLAPPSERGGLGQRGVGGAAGSWQSFAPLGAARRRAAQPSGGGDFLRLRCCKIASASAIRGYAFGERGFCPSPLGRRRLLRRKGECPLFCPRPPGPPPIRTRRRVAQGVNSLGVPPSRPVDLVGPGIAEKMARFLL